MEENITFSREKRGNSYYWIARNPPKNKNNKKGTINSITKVKNSGLKNLFDVRNKFKNDKTLVKNSKKYYTTNLIRTETKGLRFKKTQKFVQIKCEIFDSKGNLKAVAYSNLYNANNEKENRSIAVHKKEATERAYKLLAKDENLDYEEDVGEALFNERGYTLQYSIVTYKER